MSRHHYTYAKNTTVPVERSRAEIERLVHGYGASRFASMLEDGFAAIILHSIRTSAPATDGLRACRSTAKLEAVESGITTFEDEFLAHIVLPGGGTVSKWMRPQIAKAYETGKLPPLLPAGNA